MKRDLIEKQDYRRKDCSISRGTGLFHQVDPGLEAFPVFSMVVGRSLPSEGGLPEDIEFI